MDRFIRRSVMVFLGLVSGMAAAMIFMPVAALFDPLLRDSGAAFLILALFGFVLDALEGAAAPLGGAMVGLVWLASLSVSCAPLLIAALIGEVARIGSVIWYMAATSIIAAAVPWSLRLAEEAGRSGFVESGDLRARLVLLFFLTGCVAGFVYWLVAGRAAGRVEVDAPPPPQPPARNWSR